MFRAEAVVLLISLLAATAHRISAEDAVTSVESYVLARYGELNTETNGRLLRVAKYLDAQLRFLDSADAQDKIAYRKLIVSLLLEAKEGNDDGAIFRNRIILLTPPHFLLSAIAPEMEEGGQLVGVLEGERNDLREHLQEQHQQGYAGTPNFRHFATYLSTNRSAKRDAIVRHMFQTDPGQALLTLMRVDFRLPSSPLDMLRSANDQQRPTIRSLLSTQHFLADLFWRKNTGASVASEQIAAAKQMLRELAGREESWVRLYVAEIMRQNPELYEEDIEAILVKAGDKPIEREPPKEKTPETEPPKAIAPKVDPPKPDPPPAATPKGAKPPEKPKKKPRQIPTPASYKPSPHVGDIHPAAVAIELNVPDGEELAEPGPGEVITSFLLLPKDITIIRQFSNRRDEPPAVLAAKGVTAQPIREKSGLSFLFGVGSYGSRGYTHGPPYAPFAGDVLQPGDTAGISLVFDRPQAVVALTVLSGDVEHDAQATLVFRDANGRELRAVNADSQYREELSYNHNSAVFRGLALDRPAIKSVDVQVVESDENQGVQLDYLCHSETPLSSVAPAHIHPLLEKLASDTFEERTTAQRELTAIGPRLLFALPEDDQIEDDQIRAALEFIRQAISASVADPSRGTTED